MREINELSSIQLSNLRSMSRRRLAEGHSVETIAEKLKVSEDAVMIALGWA